MSTSKMTEADAYNLAELPANAAPSSASEPAPGSISTDAAEAARTAEAAAPKDEDEAKPAVAPADAPKPKPGALPAPESEEDESHLWDWDAPSWGVSVMVHAAVLIALMMVAVGERVAGELGSIDAALVDTSLSEQQAEELVTILEDPTEQERDLASATSSSFTAGASTSATPAIRAEVAAASETSSLKGLIDVAPPVPSTAVLPPTSMLNTDLSRGGRVSGDVGRPTSDYGEALDQLAREILIQLNSSRVTVLWMFDESGSMKDDQRTISDRFDRVVDELRLRVPADRRAAGDLEHAIIGFGESIHFENQKPTADLDRIRQTIDRLPVDESGEEKTMRAIIEAVNRYSRIVERDRRLLLVLVTDESGDDGGLVEEARLALVNHGVILYVLGRQAMFGYDKVRLRYVDPVTKDVYWPAIRRGPESAGFEQLTYDGLNKGRWDEQPSGFAPYELARLVEETGGIYFLLPNEEELRVKRGGENAYSMSTLREYVPDYGPRPEYLAKVAQSDLRRAMNDIIQITHEDFGFRRHYPIEPPKFAEAMNEELPKVQLQLEALMEFERRLRALKPARDTEPDRRWQANYDLMLAMTVAFQVKAYEYRACLKEMVQLARQGRLVPKNPPIPGRRHTDWAIHHSQKPKAPTKETAKKYEEAERLLNAVIESHPDTPWADLARTTLNRGLSCHWGERNVNPDYAERAKLVPKY